MTENNEKCPECGESYSESGKQTPRSVQLKTKNTQKIGVLFDMVFQTVLEFQ